MGFNRITDWCNSRKFTWEFVSAAEQFQNGQAERMVGLIKKALCTIIGTKVCTYDDLSTFFKEAENIVNSRPLSVRGNKEFDVDLLSPYYPFALADGQGIY